MKKPVVVGIALVLAILAVIVYSSIGLARFRVEVCVAYRDRTNCRTAAADTEEHALRSATANACAEIVSGMTETLQCEQSAPVKVSWRKR